jgi:two-component system phosphate regulon sensor histidine kinase PhoR
MPGEDAVAQHEPVGRGGALAVVACPTAEDRQAIERRLTAGGLRVVGAADTSTVLAELLRSRPDVLVIDLELALGYTGSVAGTLTEHPDLADLPVLLIMPEGGAGPLPPTIAPYVSDVLFRPVEQVELLHRTRAAIARRHRQQTRRDASARIRGAMRDISAGIRATNDPEVMMERFLSGAGEALGAHHTALQIFSDDRVAPRSTSWSAARATTPPSPPRDDHRAGELELALELWEGSTVASFSNPAGPRPGTGEAGVITAAAPGTIAPPGWLLDALGEDAALQGVVLAFGEGDTPFGLLWVVCEGPLAWSGVQAALTQHVLGNLAHGLIQAQLISRQQQAVRKLRALNQARSDFVGSVNHELRTPLASITGYLEMILDGVGGELPEEARTMLQAVERNTAKLHQLIEDISAVSAQQAEDADHGPVDLGHLVADLVRALAQEAAESGVDLSCSLPAGAVVVSGNREELDTALGIVLSNALRFTGTTGTVTVELTVDETAGSVRVEITDTGVGIPGEALPVDASPGPAPHDGPGVGLSVVRRTFEAHLGTIDITSELGIGTTVAVTLPLLDNAAVGGPDSPWTDTP